MSRAFALLLVGSSLWAAGRVDAAPCPPSAELAGDSALVASVGEQLAHHGVAAPAADCAPTRARLERRGTTIVVVRVGEPTEERTVSDSQTAATVIESWSRSDFQDPLLVSRPLAIASVSPPRAEVLPEPRHDAETPTAARPYVVPIIEVFAAGETSFADDRTSWAGAVIGVCIRVGRICVSARGRAAAVVAGPGMWSQQERHAADVVFGGDIPFGFGSTTLEVGFGAGMGSVHTGARANGMDVGSETFGLRADAHLGWMIPLAHRISIELSAAIDVAQVTDVERSSTPEAAGEPRWFGRLGAGLRFGAN